MKVITVIIPRARADADEVYDHALDYFCHQSHCPTVEADTVLLTTEDNEEYVRQLCADFNLAWTSHKLF